MLTLSSSLSMYPWPQVSGRPDLSLVGTEAARRSGTVARRITSARAFVRARPRPLPFTALITLSLPIVSYLQVIYLPFPDKKHTHQQPDAAPFPVPASSYAS
jgi:hypothetical protein